MISMTAVAISTAEHTTRDASERRATGLRAELDAAGVVAWHLDVIRGCVTVDGQNLFRLDRRTHFTSPTELLDFVHPDDRSFVRSALVVVTFAAGSISRGIHDTVTNPSR